MENERDVVVIGAGLAGLVAGATCTAGGASTVVLESHQQGGRARVVERDGFHFNMGAHALYLGGPGTAVLRSLGVEPQGTPPPVARYRLLAGGALHRFPAGPSSLARTTALGSRGKVELARLMAGLGRLDPVRLATISFDGWLADRGLRPDTEAVVRAIVRLSTYHADGGVSAGAVVRQLQIAARPGVTYLHGGWTQLTDALCRRADVRQGEAVTGIEAAAGRLAVTAGDSTWLARHVVVAAGAPPAARALLPDAPGWDAGPPVTAACLDVGVRRVPEPGYVVSADDPCYGSLQSPPATGLAPEGAAVLGLLRYGARTAAEDRPQLAGLLARCGVREDDVVTDRFLARMTVAGGSPRPETGGLAGRPAVDATGLPGVSLAGDWVGPDGLLADAALASGHAAARRALGVKAPAAVA